MCLNIWIVYRLIPKIIACRHLVLNDLRPIVFTDGIVENGGSQTMSSRGALNLSKKKDFTKSRKNQKYKYLNRIIIIYHLINDKL